MIEFLNGLPEWTRVIIAMCGIGSILAIVAGLLYRLIKYGLHIRAGNIEIDADNTPGE